MSVGRLLDERFLRPHPRTALWWQQREQCRACAHCVEVVLDAGRDGASMSQRCARGTSYGPGRRSRVLNDSAACIHMRDEGMPCGPEGRLFEARAVA